MMARSVHMPQHSMCRWWLAQKQHSQCVAHSFVARAAHATGDVRIAAMAVVRIAPCAGHDSVRLSGTLFCQNNGSASPCGRNFAELMVLLMVHAAEKMNDARRHTSTSAYMPSHCTIYGGVNWCGYCNVVVYFGFFFFTVLCIAYLNMKQCSNLAPSSSSSTTIRVSFFFLKSNLLIFCQKNRPIFASFSNTRMPVGVKPKW